MSMSGGFRSPSTSDGGAVIVVITLATVWMRAHRAGAVEPGSTPV
jgi:hypothetical protein